MSATNKTTNYNLPLFMASDIPSWLTDFNGAMTTIDTQIKSASTTGGVSQADFNALATRVTTLESNYTTLIAKLQNITKVGATTAGITAQEYDRLTKINA